MKRPARPKPGPAHGRSDQPVAPPDPPQEVEELRLRLEEAEQMLQAIRSGEVDSLVVEGAEGPRIYTLEPATNPYRALVEAMSEGAATVSETGAILYCNSRFAQMLDAPLHQVMGSSIRDHIAASSRSTFEALLRRAGESGSKGELSMRTRTGEEVPAYLSIGALVDSGRRVLCLVATDLGEQKRNEEIVASERLARSVLEQAAEAIVVCDVHGRIIRASAASGQLCGENPLLRPFGEVFPLDLTAPAAPTAEGGGEVPTGDVVDAALSGIVLRAARATLRRPDGSISELLVSATALRGAGDHTIGCVVSLVDVTEMRRAEQALRDREERLAVTLRSIGDAVIATDDAGRVTLLNGVAEEVTGWKSLEAVGRPLEDVFHIIDEDTEQPTQNPVERVLREGTIVGLANHTALVARDGTRRPIADSAAPIRDASGRVTGVVLVFRDQTEERRAEDALRRAKEDWERTFDSVPDLIALLDDGYRITRVNRAMAEKLGRHPRECVGLRCYEVVHGLDAPPAACPHVMKLADGREHTAELHEDRLGGDFLVSTTPLVGVEGRVSGVVHVARDITERRRTEERVRRQNAVLAGMTRIFRHALTAEHDEELGDTCLAVAESVTRSKFAFLGEIDGETGRIDDVAVSDPGWEACRMKDRSGHGRRLAAGLEIHGLFGRVVADGRSLLTNDPRAHPDSIGTPPGHPPLEAFLGVPLLRNDKVIGIVGLGNREGGYGPEDLEAAEALAPAIVQAFSSKRAEEARRESEESLRLANARLEEAARRKDEFLGMLSHELRNPLAPLHNSLYVLERSQPGSEAAARAQAIMRRQAEHLTHLVDDLLDVTRISRGKIKLHLARVDASELVRRACDDHWTLYQERGLTLSVDAPSSLWIDADETRILQVIGNLLQNAARFSQERGAVTVSVRTADEQVEISVRDEGIGITPEFLPWVFEPFVQEENTFARTKGGLGLGLALVKGLVELHEGSVLARSEGRGRGAEFLVTLPKVPAPSQPLPRSPSLPSMEMPRALKVLVIEDNVDEATSLREALKLVGHEVQVAREGPEGIEKARSFRPDAVLCDIGLPGMNGYDVARAIRADPALSATRLIAVTGYARPEDVLVAREVGFDHHIAKPAPIPELEEIMRAPPGEREATYRGMSRALPRTPAVVGRGPRWSQPEGVRGATGGASPQAVESFVSRAVHDLRAPLRHIDSFTEALLEDCGDRLGEVGRGRLHKIRLARKRAQELIDDLLTLWRVTNADLSVVEVDLTALAREVWSRLCQAEPGRKVDFHLEEGVVASGAPDLLRVVMENLLGNAWKYTSRRPSAHVEFGQVMSSPGPTFFVRDDGEGVDAARAKRLFEPFERLHAKSEFEGTGLGLHMVRRVVERHGGRAWIESTPGTGTVVYFTLGSVA